MVVRFNCTKYLVVAGLTLLVSLMSPALSEAGKITYLYKSAYKTGDFTEAEQYARENFDKIPKEIERAIVKSELDSVSMDESGHQLDIAFRISKIYTDQTGKDFYFTKVNRKKAALMLKESRMLEEARLKSLEEARDLKEARELEELKRASELRAKKEKENLEKASKKKARAKKIVKKPTQKPVQKLVMIKTAPKVVVTEVKAKSIGSDGNEDVSGDKLLYMFMTSLKTGKHIDAIKTGRENPISFGTACYKVLTMLNAVGQDGMLKKDLLQIAEVMTTEYMKKTGITDYYKTYSEIYSHTKPKK